MAANDPIERPQESPGWRYYLQEKVLVIFCLGFSSGLPFPLVYATLSAWLNEAGIEKSTISTFAWLGFAYSLKFVWAPIVDSTRLPILGSLLGHRRGWMLLAQLSVGVCLVVMSGVDPNQNIEAFALIAFAVAFSSATQDIVVDAYRIECAEDRMQGVLAAAYQYGYRISLLISMAGAFFLADHISWSMIYKVMAACMAIGIATTLWCKEPAAVRKQFSYSGKSLPEKISSWFIYAVADPFADFYRRFGEFFVVILVFVSLYRVSDYVLGILANPFYRDIGYTYTEIAAVAKLYGTWVTLFGVGAGGWAVVKFGVARCLVIATTLIASTNLFFALMVTVGAELWMLAVTISADNIAQGFGGTVLIAYLSSLTDRMHTATQYALLSSIMALFPKFLAGYSGNVQEWMGASLLPEYLVRYTGNLQELIGYLGFFLYAAAIGVPAIVLALIVARRHDSMVSRARS